MRKMASVQTILNIKPIEGADLIECAVINGWNVVTKKGEFAINDNVVYCEIDSWIPHDIAPFLSKPEPKQYNNVLGNRLKTAKLRGCISQGLILPTSLLSGEFNVGDDVSELLGIQKYDPPIPASIAGMAKGNFPSFIPKTDEERVQNLGDDIFKVVGKEVYITEKLDGTSFTAYVYDGEEGVCSRNLDLKETDENTLWQYAREHNLHDKLKTLPFNAAIQGELIGCGIQGNKYKRNKFELYVYNLYNIDEKRYLTFDEFTASCDALCLASVPVIETCIFNYDVQGIIGYADGKSVLFDTLREGVVIRTTGDDRVSFKAISNKWLLKNDE